MTVGSSPRNAHLATEAASLPLDIAIGSWRISVRRTLPEADNIAKMYNHVAWRWGAVLHLLGYTQAYARLFAELSRKGELAGLDGQSAVLDAGIGTGGLTLALAHQLRAPPRFDGIDISVRMLTRARRNLLGLGGAGRAACLRVGDVCSLPYDDERFDMVVSGHVIEHCSRPEAAISELVRVLRPGGRLLLVSSRCHTGNLLQGLRWRFRSMPAAPLVDLLHEAGVNQLERVVLGPRRSLPAFLSEAYYGIKSSQPIQSACEGPRCCQSGP